MKALSWILLILGVIGAWLGFVSGYGMLFGVISVIVALIGLWMVMKKGGSMMQMPPSQMPPQM
jgi:hypothetical protein